MRFSIYSNLGNEIKNLRKSKNITQKKMAEMLEIPYSTYSNYENDNRTPDEETLNRISSILDITTAQLLENIRYSNIGRNIFHTDTPNDKSNYLEIVKSSSPIMINVSTPLDSIKSPKKYLLENSFSVDTKSLSDSEIDELFTAIEFTIKLKLSEFNMNKL